MKTLRIALAQINCTVGDLDGNRKKILDGISAASDARADIVAFPELAVTGYPPEDLLLKPQFVERNIEIVKDIASGVGQITAVVGFVDMKTDIYNAAAVIRDGEIRGVYHKSYLPNYGVFDEARYFQREPDCPVFRLGDFCFGVNICEDIWYPGPPTEKQALAGAELIINISSSPFHAKKGADRARFITTRATDYLCYMAFCNLVGGQDELIFDGHSLVVDLRGETVARGAQFEEDLVIADLEMEAVFRARLHDPRRRQEWQAAARESDRRLEAIGLGERKPHPDKAGLERHLVPLLSPEEEIYRALVLGTRDYVRKNGFKNVVIGLSGGVDSALVADIAATALGPENVNCVFMPSEFTSRESREDAEAMANSVGVKLQSISIVAVVHEFEQMMEPAFEGRERDVTEENIQARIRGAVLMALSNKFGWLVLTTGNKSETATGYATLYGDMAGGLAILKDLTKTQVYDLCRWRNRISGREVIPQRIIEKAPSAELKPDQTDQDTLPPYNVLDPILRAYVEDDLSAERIVEMGFDANLVKSVIGMVDRNEYKRRQAPPGLRISPRAFGKDRRLPITNRFHD